MTDLLKLNEKETRALIDALYLSLGEKNPVEAYDNLRKTVTESLELLNANITPGSGSLLVDRIREAVKAHSTQKRDLDDAIRQNQRLSDQLETVYATLRLLKLAAGASLVDRMAEVSKHVHASRECDDFLDEHGYEAEDLTTLEKLEILYEDFGKAANALEDVKNQAAKIIMIVNEGT